MRRTIAVLILATGALLATSGIARAQFTEQIDGYDVAIELRTDGSLRITEVIDYDFGVTEHHGIFRDVPTRVHYDDTYDRVYPLTVESVSASGGASADYTVEQDGSLTRIKIGDPDETISGEHTYTIVYTIEGATNGFGDHDELYWNAIGDTWAVSIDDVTVNVEAPGAITDSLCFQGPERSTLPCDGQKVRGSAATFRQQHLDPYSGVTIVLAFPKGVLDEPAPILEERWSLSSAFRLTPVTGGVRVRCSC